MKKPYTEKISKIAGFNVWQVNGYWIRKNLDKEFTNFGQHYRFKFIPKNEFWIDKEASKRKETKYFIQDLLLMNRFMEEGVNHKRAVKMTNDLLKAERLKLKSVKKLEKEKKDKEKIIKRVHKRFLRRLSGEVKVWLVRGDLVRSLFFVDFTQGGHDKFYNFIPKGEIWIDDDVYYKEIPFIIVHELHERYLMSKGLSYNEAHFKASDIEYFYRHNPKKLNKRLKLEIKRNKV